MSYSFSFTADTREAAKTAAAEQFDAKALPYQPVHSRDRAAALANAATVIDLLDEPSAGEHVVVSMHGALGWRGNDQSTAPLTNANVACSAYLAPAGRKD